MKLNNQIIEEISKKLKIGMYAKVAARAEGISERTYYRWKTEGDELLKQVLDNDGEIIDREFKKLTDTEKLKIQFCQSIDRSDAEAESILVATIVSAAQDDWKAALQILQRRFPERWASKEYFHVDGGITEKPNMLKEFEDEFFGNVPESGMKNLVKEMGRLIKDASTNEKHASKAKG